MDNHEMIREQIESRGVRDPSVVDAMLRVERDIFVPYELRNAAYDDRPLPIGYGQTISQPFIVAYMLSAAQLERENRVLEVGTGSGYQTALLAEMVKEVYTIELNVSLGSAARVRLEEIGYRNIHFKIGDGYEGWKEEAPFDAVIITAAPPSLPEALIKQLKTGGRLVAPVGVYSQELYLVKKKPSGIDKTPLLPVAFVPMQHAAG